MESRENLLQQNQEAESAFNFETQPTNPDLNAERLANPEMQSVGELSNVLQEAQVNAVGYTDSALPNTLPEPVVPLASNTLVASASNPVVAADDEVIEKEWVSRAKHIVAATKDNPVERDDEVSKLKIDYRKKRFGDVPEDTGK